MKAIFSIAATTRQWRHTFDEDSTIAGQIALDMKRNQFYKSLLRASTSAHLSSQAEDGTWHGCASPNRQGGRSRRGDLFPAQELAPALVL